MMMQKNKLRTLLGAEENLFYRRVVGVLIIIIISGVLLWMIYGAREIFLMLAIAYLLMLSLKTPITNLRKWTKNRMSLVVATAIVYFVLLGLIIAMVAFVIPSLVMELMNFAKAFNLTGIVNFINHIDLEKLDLGAIISNMGQFGSSVLAGATATFGALFAFVTTFIISFHLSLQNHKIKLLSYQMTKKEDVAAIVEDYSKEIDLKLGGWLRGEAMLMLTIGLISYIGFAIMGIPYALPLAVLAGLLELVPNLGPIIAAIPAVGLALMVSWPIALATLVFCVVLQQLENVFIVPKVMKTAANISPIVSIVLVLTGMELFGVFGALLAIPIFLVIKTTWIYFVRDKKYIKFLGVEEGDKKDCEVVSK